MSGYHGKLIWAELMTTDTAAGGAFYGDVVGWRVRDMSMPDIGTYHVFEMDDEGGVCHGVGGMMTIPPELDGKVPPNWTGYIAVDDVDRSVADAVALGGSVRRPAEDIPSIGRFAVIADPHGGVVCIMTPLPMPDAPPPPSMVARGQVGWQELYAGDLEEAFAFYSKLFGWTVNQDMDMGEMGVYRIFAYKGEPVGGMMKRPATMPMAFWCYYLNVEAIDAAIARVTGKGGKIVFGPQEVPGGSWIVQGVDPQGAFFALVAPKR
ncbi:VOC family protein [Ensifer soli]|uniref:VOC family protein n=1 Tax=Ciceribacter sp. sgz301302 TaxID=3342379 RepID=UPI0035BB7B32